jgi:hypothetical protein
LAHMADADDIQDAVAADMVSGDEERQIADRRVRKVDPLKRLEVADQIAARSSTRGAKIYYGFS